MPWTPEQQAEQAAKSLRDGEFVDIGNGLAQDVLRHIPAGTEIWVHLGEALPGMTQYPTDDYMDAGFIVTGQDSPLAQRTMAFHSSDSFAAMSSTTADTAIREADSAAQARTVVADALQSMRVKRVMVLVNGYVAAREIWQDANPGVEVRLITPKEIFDVAPDGRQNRIE